MTVEQRNEEPKDQFPVGMRVLAVDDDPTCLRLLEILLRKCQYHVTTTSQAIGALKLLRENKNKFDLVISDVHMPDMDGFKLLELVGLEMDLPVIMLSANSDPRVVMKGITHGACDYLLKPVRMEELKNIWQHVIRRRKVDSKEPRNDHSNKLRSENGGSVPGSTTVVGDSDKNGKLNRKRKDQIEDDDEEHDDNENNDDQDSSTQKKPRVVWSVDLHRKFVAAVNHLGIERAVPKRILDMMNVEKLTRENVASHLQKYRLYLKRISCVANQQANLVAALGRTGSPYMHMGSLTGAGNIHDMSGFGQFQNPAFMSSSPGGMLGRLNSPAGLATRGLSSSGFVPVGGHIQNPNNLIGGSIKFQPVILAGPHQETQRKDGTSLVPSLQGHPEELQRRGVFGNQYPSTVLASPNAEFSNFPGNNATSNDEWRSTLHNPHDVTSITSGLNQLLDSRTDFQCQTVLASGNTAHDIKYIPKAGWDDGLDEASRSMSSVISSHGYVDPFCHRNEGMNLIEQSNFVDPVSIERNGEDQLAVSTQLKPREGYLMEQRKPRESYSYNNIDSLDDIVSVMMKQEQARLVPRGENIGCDSFSLGTTSCAWK